MPGVVVNLSGSQTVSTQTDAEGRYRFEGLPTSGVYTATPVEVNHTFDPLNWITTTPSGDSVANFTATLIITRVRSSLIQPVRVSAALRHTLRVQAATTQRARLATKFHVSGRGNIRVQQRTPLPLRSSQFVL